MPWFHKSFQQAYQDTGGQVMRTGFMHEEWVGNQPLAVGDPISKQLCDWLNRNEGAIQEFRMLEHYALIYRAEQELD
jgi:hypothetical protein